MVISLDNQDFEKSFKPNHHITIGVIDSKKVIIKKKYEEKKIQLSELILSNRFGEPIDLKAIKKRVASHPQEVNERDYNDIPPIFYAAQENNYEVVKLLIENGAEIDVQDKYGNTPLLQAISTYQIDERIVRLLLDYGADMNRKNFYNISPLTLAQTATNMEVILSIFEEYSK